MSKQETWVDDVLRLRQKWGFGHAPIADAAMELLQTILDHHSFTIQRLKQLDKIEGFSSPKPSNKAMFEFVKAKADIYKLILHCLDLNAKTCPFCQTHTTDPHLFDLDCDYCEYGHVAGYCNQTDSVYNLLTEALGLLRLLLTWYGDPFRAKELLEATWSQLFNLLQKFLYFCKMKNVQVEPVICLGGNGIFLDKASAIKVCQNCSYFDKDEPCNKLRPLDIPKELLLLDIA